MKLKVLLSLGLLAMVGTGADAATVYTLQSIRYDNPFATNYRVPGGTFGGGGGTIGGLCIGCGVSTATDDGAGNITIIGAAWKVSSFGQGYQNSFDATTTLGSDVALSKTNRTCTTLIPGTTFCTGDFSGLGGSNTWGVDVSQNTATACDPIVSLCQTNVFVSGTELYVERQVALSEAQTGFQRYTLIYSTVPVPAAVWLFGSSLGLLGLARRKAKVA